MKTRLALGSVGLLSATFAYACVDHTPEDPSPARSTAAPIEGGNLINLPDYPISSQFPKSTVFIATPLPGSDTLVEKCTGVIIAPTKILTAAHCNVGSTSTVYFYATKPGSDAIPVKNIKAAASNAVAVQPGIICPGTRPRVDATCRTKWGPQGEMVTSHYADLAVLTLASPIPTGYRPALLASANSFAARQSAQPPPATWAVGTGKINLFISGCPADAEWLQNPDREMRWVNTYHLGEVDGGGYSDSDGLILAPALFVDSGDSGGPLYQLGPTPDGGAPNHDYNLVLIGLASFGTDCWYALPDGGLGTIVGDTDLTTGWTSLLEPENHAWVVQQGATVAPMLSYGTFGASL